jgi:16S rRNA (guanine1207-N2)-methyltransferase
LNPTQHPALETLLLAFSAEGGLIPPARALFLGAQPHHAFKQWPTTITGWQPFKPAADAWDYEGFHRVDEIPAATWPLVMILPGKSRDETLALFATARKHLDPGGVLLAALANHSGAARFEKELSRATHGISSLQKYKCRAFHASMNDSWDQDLFESWDLLNQARPIENGRFITRPGIFSSEHVDPGSRLLAEHIPSHLRGAVADLGAGWGYLSDEALRRCPGITRIDLFEADSRALDCARINLASHPQDIQFHWHDVTTGLPGVYDAVLMNPPFHSGRAATPDLGAAFITRAATALRRGGALFLVANRQLPYESVLQTTGMAWRKTFEDSTFKILTADKR